MSEPRSWYAYLATPYSQWPHGLDDAHRQACRLAWSLISRGVPVYSPIAHMHPIAMVGGLDPTDHELWLTVDEAMMAGAAELLIADLPGWRQSRGVAIEMRWFVGERRPIWVLDTLSLDRRGLTADELAAFPYIDWAEGP